MVQQVQTAITTTPENTLETIEAIWTSSRKIIIGRQTRERIYEDSWVTLTFTVPFHWYSEGDVVYDIPWTWALSDETGEWDYMLVDEGVRIPVQGYYSLTITTFHGSSLWVTTKTWVDVNDREVYTKSNSTNNDITETITLTLGKFSRINVRVGISTSINTNRWWSTPVVIKKL